MRAVPCRAGLGSLACLLAFGCSSTALASDPPAGAATSTAAGWQIKFYESGSRPVIANGVLYVGSADGAVHALDSDTGAARWRFQTGESLAPAASGATVVTVPPGTGFDGQLRAGIEAAEKQRQAGTRKIDMTPVVENGIVFVGSGDRSFYAIDAATGQKKWSYQAGPGMANPNNSSTPVPGPVVRDGTVYFLTEDGLHALDSVTGTRRWLFETLREIPLQEMNGRRRAPEGMVLADGIILVTAFPFQGQNTPQKSFLYAVDAESGKARWIGNLVGRGASAPVTAAGLAFSAVLEPGPTEFSLPTRTTLHAVNMADGQVRWKAGAERKHGSTRLLVVDKTIHFATDKSVLALDLETGRQVWSFGADDIQGDLLADDQRLYVVTHKGSLMAPKDTLHALALATGQEKWARAVGDGALALVRDGVVYADGGHLQAIDAATGKDLWSFKGAGRLSLRLSSGGRLFLSSPTVSSIGTDRTDQGHLYAIDARTGKLKP